MLRTKYIFGALMQAKAYRGHVARKGRARHCQQRAEEYGEESLLAVDSMSAEEGWEEGGSGGDRASGRERRGGGSDICAVASSEDATLHRRHAAAAGVSLRSELGMKQRGEET